MKHALDETTQHRVDRLWEYSKNLEEVPLCRSVGHKSECLYYVEEHLHQRFGYPAKLEEQNTGQTVCWIDTPIKEK